MPATDIGFAIKYGLVDALRAAVAAAGEGDDLFGVEVYDSWPEKGVQEERSILVLDFTFDEVGATMRAGGGTRDKTISLDVAVAVWDYESDARLVAAQTSPILAQVEGMVRVAGATLPVFGVPGIRQPTMRAGRVAEYVLDKGKRECDVHLTVQFTGRVVVGA